MTTKQNIPAIRFPEFQDDWKRLPLHKMVFVNPSSNSLPEKFIYIDLDSVSQGQLLKENEIYASKAPSRAQRVLEKQDIIFQVVRPYQKNNYFFDRDGDFVASTGYAQLRTKENSPAYIYQFLHTEIFVKKVIVRCTGTSYPAINSSDLAKIPVNFPKKEEQEKIATFLGAVDEKIAQLSKKKELLEAYKKSVMQKIFKQEIRFKDDNGNTFPDWKEKPLGKITDRVTEKNIDDAINYVLTNSATQGVVSQQDYFEKDIANQENLQGYYIVRNDDFVYNPRVSSTAPVGPIKRNHLSIGVMSPLYSVFRFTEGNLDFYERYFETSLWHRYLHSVANIGARHDRMNITTSDFQKMPLPFPHPDEQKKIAEFLGTLDKKIDLVNGEFEGAQAFKKGLLQQMFV